MIGNFIMNGYLWKIKTVHPNSEYLMSRNGMTVATTDPEVLCVYLAEDLKGVLKKRVIAHEMGHAACFSFGLLEEIEECCFPEKRIQMEEFICNFVADYGEMIFSITYAVLGDEALEFVPYHLERLVS